VVADAHVVGGWLPAWVSLGVLAESVPREVVDEAVAVTGKEAQRSGGKLPPHVMVYFAMALALFADDDYEEVAVRLTETLEGWGCWDREWTAPTSGGITSARQRLGPQPMVEVFGRIAVPVAEELIRGAFLGPWRLMSIDGIEWDAPDTPENVAAFGYPGSAENPSAFAKVRMVTVAECASHAVVAAVIGARWQAEQTLAASLYPHLGADWLLLADRGFYSFTAWNAARSGGTQLLWRVKADLRLPLVEALPDGSYLSVLIDPKIRGKTRDALVAAARAGDDLDSAKAVLVRVVEYTVPDRTGDGKDELIALITTVTEVAAAPAQMLAHTYHDRWEHEMSHL
jgi:hypothetical protein